MFVFDGLIIGARHMNSSSNGLLSKTLVRVELAAHGLGILHDVDDTAIVAHLEAVERTIACKHIVILQLVLHPGDDRGGRKRFPAGDTGEGRIAVQCPRPLARFGVEQQARRQADCIFGAGLYAGAALQAVAFDEEHLGHFTIRPILQRSAHVASAMAQI